MWYYACRYSPAVYACSSVLLPQWSSCIYNSAMLLDCRMPFFPISLHYNSPWGYSCVNQGMSCKVCIIILLWNTLWCHVRFPSHLFTVHCNYCQETAIFSIIHSVIFLISAFSLLKWELWIDTCLQWLGWHRYPALKWPHCQKPFPLLYMCCMLVRGKGLSDGPED